ncbi:hypothetical protein [Comamonas sp. A7-5]|uniref:hypothetical protein n=1 Tax=Comamonas sp. A7-5 TaxID=673549 RepID=UPI0031D8A39C
MHWSDSYIDIPHDVLDCAQLVERALHEQFGRIDIHFPRRQADDLAHRSALITANQADFAKWIEEPVDGCGVLMLARGRQAHIGLYCLIQGVPYVLHSDALFGSSMRQPLARLPRCYRVEGFYQWL